ncbi:MAG: DUF262 domain-containing protein [Lachnospiraceae bacterium]|nr:DUF262 domain-containing protein [Lachnospiraceae bacterium]
MEIRMHEIPIREVFDGYQDSQEEGVVAYGGKLNVRPAFQREFVYKDKQRDEVIHTIRKGFPLNVMYWVKSGDGYELMDGQQRTISFCQFINGDFSINDGHTRYFHTLTESEQQIILDYKLTIYICEGTDQEKLDWFKIINIAGEQLTDQELRNAIYTGTWLSDAKKYFSKSGCPAYQIAGDYLIGTAIRQDYLQTAITWIAYKDKTELEEYMASHRQDADAHEMWLYFKSVIDWTQAIFPKYRKEMKGVQWGLLYNRFKDKSFNPAELEKEVTRLMADDDVTKKSGIYEFLLDGEEKHLSIRTFTQTQMRTQYEKQGGFCPKCLQHFELNEMEGDHITPWSQGGHTTPDNLQMLCKPCNRRKSDR